MSARKTIHALRTERTGLYAEIRRLQKLAGENPTIRQMAQHARELNAGKPNGIVDLNAPDVPLPKVGEGKLEVSRLVIGCDMPTARMLPTDEAPDHGKLRLGFSFLENRKRQLDVPVFMLFGYADHTAFADAMRAKGIEVDGTEDDLRKIAEYTVGNATSCEDEFRRLYMGTMELLGPDWRQAPPDATHVLRKYSKDTVIWLKLDKNPSGPAFRWDKTTFAWVPAYRNSQDALDSDHVTPRPEPTPDVPHVQVHLYRGGESLKARINVADDVPLITVYDTAADSLRQFCTLPRPSAVSVNGGKCEPGPWFDWEDAPEGATHAITGMPVIWLKCAEGETAQLWRTSFMDKPAHWWDTGHASELYMGSNPACSRVTPRPVPEQTWSVSGDNGSWDYSSLNELIRDNYGCPEEGTSFAPGLGMGLKVGAVVKFATVCKPDPAAFVQGADEILEWMGEAAMQSDAGEWSDGYPFVEGDKREALDKVVRDLKRWAREHCQPDFFTVKGISEYQVTAADVAAALAAYEAEQ